MAIERPIKRGNVRQFDESYQRGFKTAWASEVDADFNTVYDVLNNGLPGGLLIAPGTITGLELADNSVDTRHIKDFAVSNTKIGGFAVTRNKIAADAWLPPIPDIGGTDIDKVLTVANGPVLEWRVPSGAGGGPPIGPAGGDLNGFYPNPTIQSYAKSKWDTSTFPFLTPTDTTKTVRVPAVNSMVFGPGPRFGAVQSEDVTAEFSLNDPWAPQDLATSSWAIQINSQNDAINFHRRAPAAAAGTVTQPFKVAGTGDVTIGNLFQWGLSVAKGRLDSSPLSSVWSINAKATGVPFIDDPTKPAWIAELDTSAGTADGFRLYRSAPGTSPTWVSMLTVDATGQLTLPTNGANNAMILGARPVKHRLITHSGLDIGYLATNASLNAAASAWAQDNAAASSWMLEVNSSQEWARFARMAPGGAFSFPMTVDATGKLSITGDFSAGPTLKMLMETTGSLYMSYNHPFGAQDATKASWALRFGVAAGDDAAAFYHRLANAAAGHTPVFTAFGTGDLTIAGGVATKAAGTAWVNPSDIRLKRDIAPYNRGLSEIQALAPIMFQFNGLGGTKDDGQMCYGLDAAAVQTVMPECVSTRQAKLQPDDKDDTELLMLDASNITWALVNAVQELATRLAAVEAR